MKRILTTLSRKWPEYLLEILVLIIGIYGAFALESWGEKKKQSKEEIEILKGCKAELLSDLKDINVNILELQKSQNSLQLIIDVLESDGQYDDSLGRHFQYTLLPIHFVHSTSSFETLKSKGLEVVSNDKIRSQLVSLYDSQYKFFLQSEAEYLDEVFYGFRHIFPGRFEESMNYKNFDFAGSTVPLNFEGLKNDQEYLYFIKSQHNRTWSYIGYFYTNLKDLVESTIKALDLEIKHLEE